MKNKEKKLIRVEYIYDDGSISYLDGKALKNYQKNMQMTGTMAATRSYIQFNKVKWKEKG